MRSARVLALLAALAVAACAGCSDDDPPAPEPGAPEAGGTLVVAATGPASRFDPLLAEGFAERLVARQVSEPLLAPARQPLVPPGSGVTASLATRAAPTDGATVWRVDLRPGVRFQDGSRLDASAVLANATRWQSLGAPAAAGLIGADSPKPGLVRFILAAPDRGFGAALASPELGLVSPRAIEADGEIAAGSASGSGPYELVGRDRGGVELRRFDDWWGAGLDLGPGFGDIVVERVGSDRSLAQLERGEASLAGEFGAVRLAQVAGDPLLEAFSGFDDVTGTGGYAAERSLRGLAGMAIPALSGVWSTELGPG